MRSNRSFLLVACATLYIAGSATIAKADITYDFTNPGNMNIEFTVQNFIQPNTSSSDWGPITFIEGSFDTSGSFAQDRSWDFINATLSNGATDSQAAWSFPNALPMSDGTYSTDFTFFQSTGYSNGSLTITGSPAVTVTPEPSSIALLGTGVLGVAGMLRKRFA
jgi:hypothetical protein